MVPLPAKAAAAPFQQGGYGQGQQYPQGGYGQQQQYGGGYNQGYGGGYNNGGGQSNMGTNLAVGALGGVGGFLLADAIFDSGGGFDGGDCGGDCGGDW